MVYLDTSVLVAYYCPEPLSAKVQRLLQKTPDRIISPLVEIEFCSAITMKVRMRELTKSQADQIFAMFQLHCDEGNFEHVAIESREYHLARQWIAGMQTSLRTMDALHLATAFANDLSLVTSDKVLSQAAKHFGVSCKHIT